MKLDRLAVLGTTTAAAVALIAAPAVAHSGHAPHTKVISSCTKAKYQPKNYVLFCGDGNAGLTHATYTHWGTKRAMGHGTYWFVVCKPSCVAGTEKKRAATFTLKGFSATSNGPLFTKIVIKYGTHTKHFSLPTSTI